MSLPAKMILVLTAITMLAGGVLSYWDSFTQPRIDYHREAARKAAIAEVLPPHESYTELAGEAMTFFVAKRDDETVGIAFQAEGSGFQGNIVMLVGVKPDFSQITGIKILEQIETPGLGTKIVQDPTHKANPDWFTAQFRGLLLEQDIEVVKNEKPGGESQVQAITGATISSEAVARIINEWREKAQRQYAQSTASQIE